MLRRYVPEDVQSILNGQPKRMGAKRNLDRPQGAPPADYGFEMADSMKILARLSTLERGYGTRQFAVGAAASRIYASTQPRGIVLLNPSRSAGLTSSGTLLPLAAYGVGTGNTKATPLGVGNYRSLAAFLDVTVNGGGGTLIVDAYTQDPLSGHWALAQKDIFAGQAAVGTYYALLGGLGVDQNFAIVYTVAVAGITFSVSYIEKDGLPGSTSGLDRTIYIGPSSAVNTVSGRPILEGQSEKFFVKEYTEIWAVSVTPVNVRILELS